MCGTMVIFGTYITGPANGNIVVFRKKLTGRSSVTLGGLLLLNIVIAILYFGIGPMLHGGTDCGTPNPGEVQTSDDEDFVIAFLINFPILLEVLSTLLYIGTRYVSMAIFAIASSWLTPSIYLMIGGPNIVAMFFVILPLAMLVHIPYWAVGSGERKAFNPLPSPVREEYLD
jgi:hypothetical protein